MSITTIKLSSKGQIVIPKIVRDELHWEAEIGLRNIKRQNQGNIIYG
jgi:bifunctional DNA-binding transcriptional regulator/antitoxin component of YhaV-PrlF toxin-antitoxin module